MRAARPGLHYDLRMRVKDAPFIEAMRDLSGQFPRFGARRINVFLSRQSLEITKDRCSRYQIQRQVLEDSDAFLKSKADGVHIL